MNPVDDLGLELIVPAGFHALPLDLDAEGMPDPDAFEDLVTGLLPHGGDEHRLVVATRILLLLRAQAAAAIEVGFAALGLLGDEQGGIAPVTLSVSRSPSKHDDPEVAARGILELLQRRHSPADGPADVRWLDLPCGPAVVDTRFERRSFAVDPAPAEDGPFLDHGRFDVHIPHPAGSSVVVVTIDSPALHVWGSVSDLAAAVVSSVRFLVAEVVAA